MNPEITVIAGLMHQPSLRHRVPKLAAKCFSALAHRWMFTVAMRLGAKLSRATLTNEVYKQSEQTKAKLAPVLAKIVACRPPPSDWSYALDEVMQSERWRRIQSGVRKAFNLVREGDKLGAEGVILALPSEVRELRGAGVAKLQDARAEAAHVHEAAYSGPRMMTGISELDHLTGGFRRGQLVLWGGLPHHGKTTFAVHAANRFVEQGHNVLFVTVEMTADEIEALILTIHSHSAVDGGVPFDWFDDRDAYDRLPENDRGKVEMAESHFAETPGYGRFFVLHPELDENLLDVFDRMEQCAIEIGSPIDALFVDYLEILAPIRSGRSVQDELRQTLVVAKRHTTGAQGGQGVLLWSPWQIKREVEKSILKRPQKYPLMSDFAESSFAERAADLMGWNYFGDSVAGMETMQMGVCKNRTTRRRKPGGWSVRVDADTCLFANLSADESLE